MRRPLTLAALSALLLPLCCNVATAHAATPSGEIVVAIRYLLPQGVSHAHLFLFREDGKLLRQLTRDETGQDMRPVFAPDGETIAFTRETGREGQETRTYWSIRPRGGSLTRLAAAPAWYKPAQNRESAAYTSPYFTNLFMAGNHGEVEEAAPHFPAPDRSAEIVLRLVKDDDNNNLNGPGSGQFYFLRDTKTGRKTEFKALPGFTGTDTILHDNGAGNQHFIWEANLHIAFFDVHLNSSDGDTVYALDVQNPRLIRLSPNWAAPFPLPGDSAFLTLTENRYVPIPGTPKTANCSYVERWDSRFRKVRFAHAGPALCYGASLYRPGRTPAVVTIPRFTP